MHTNRVATPSDRDAIRAVHALAFAGAEAEPVARLACDLLDETGTPPTLSLVAEAEEGVVGHVAFSPVSFTDACELKGSLLAPLGVKPRCQKRGVGTRLVEEGFKRSRERGVDVLLVYGDPSYYGRFGFTAEDATRFVPPYELEHPFGWLAVSLSDRRPPEQPVRVACVRPLCDPGLW